LIGWPLFFSIQVAESLRAACGGVCKAPLIYLADSGIEHDGLGGVISSVCDQVCIPIHFFVFRNLSSSEVSIPHCIQNNTCDQVFRVFLSRLVTEGRSTQREAVLLDHALFFLAHCCHRFARVRSAAFSYIVQVRFNLSRIFVQYVVSFRLFSCVQLADQFPQLLWRQECISALLETVETISRRVVQGNSPPLHGRVPSGVSGSDLVSGAASVPVGTNTRDPFGESDGLRVRGVPTMLEPPASASQLADVLSDVTELTCQWLLRGIINAPAETRVAFQRYIARAAAAVSAFGATSSHFAGLATGLYAVSPTAPVSGMPIVATYNMASVARAALSANPSGNRGIVAATASLPVLLSSLSSSGTRVRWTSAAPAAAASSLSAQGVGFQSTSWARHSLPQILSREAAAVVDTSGVELRATAGDELPRELDDVESVLGGIALSARSSQRVVPNDPLLPVGILFCTALDIDAEICIICL
jgi:hypothetical protein